VGAALNNTVLEGLEMRPRTPNPLSRSYAVAARGALEFVENAFGADSFAAIHFQIQFGFGGGRVFRLCG
jgi:hypothetical protein